MLTDIASVRDLMSPYELGSLRLRNRMVMAPMTRGRASDDGVQGEVAAAYYAQRASAGLIISEGAQVSQQGVGHIRTAGVHTAGQVAAWKTVTEAVHAAGGLIYAQLWHVGRISHPDFHEGELPVAPSALPVEGRAFTENGFVDIVVPRELGIDELPGIVEQFRSAARMAKKAGFDGVELHGANGYLLDQFTRDGSNHRKDAYGGDLAGRTRLPLEIARAVAEVWGGAQVGYRVSPNYSDFSMSDSDPAATFTYLVSELSKLGIGYLHLIEPIGGEGAPADRRLAPLLRRAFNGTFMLVDGYDAATAEAVLERGEADLIAFGAPFLANPDLVDRYRTGAALNTPDEDTYYQGEERGYIDYPTLTHVLREAA